MMDYEDVDRGPCVGLTELVDLLRHVSLVGHLVGQLKRSQGTSNKSIVSSGLSKQRGRNSIVEYQLPKLKVAPWNRAGGISF
jgi:hypothetical protein